MDDDQQFCLRWNNHQSTLVAVFDTLLENGTLVDCTLAAEGKFLNAHKVVLSACSPYFEALLSRHYDKHPILILKDVKFQELKAMMDYMYRGEVNISQDQLAALLKAAESLQIKGLSDNKKDEPNRKPAATAPPPKSPQPQSALPKVQGLTIEQRSRDDREGSMSPGPRKKKRMRRKSEEMDNHNDHASNSSDAHSLPATNIPTTAQLPASVKLNSSEIAAPEQIETKQEILSRHAKEENVSTGQSQHQQHQVPIIKEKIETHTELMLEPKSEYVDEMNEDSIEDLTLDDDDLSNMEQMDDGAGPSHGGEGSSQQGFGQWHMGNQSQDEVFLAAQEAVGAHRDSQGQTVQKEPKTCLNKLGVNFRFEPGDDIEMDVAELADLADMSNFLSVPDDSISCDICGTLFRHISSLRYHRKHKVCLKPKREELEPKVLQCHICEKIFNTISGLNYHMRRKVCEQQDEEKEEEIIQCEMCNTVFKHMTSLRYHLTHKVCLKPKKEEMEPKPLQCESCEKIFSTTTALNYHLKNRVCEPKEPKEPKEPAEILCKLCGTLFKHLTSLRYHLKHKVCLKPKKEEIEPKLLQCEVCQKVFTSNSSLEYHVKRRVCEQQRVILSPPFTCDYCGTSFELRQTWYAHIKRQVCKKYPERYIQKTLESTVKIEVEEPFGN
ncbi:protein bric-a-brac 2-like isoform X2 [Cylas formicarius]|uniref:protein bric-a-brac 2-like isoform X2 n=1 Tax=Cylas formicarius TaxID=197179 RepID=UPI002958D300|nr:protein bric-a-brac 2-like isoform X2 [Cylas formicarius]